MTNEGASPPIVPTGGMVTRKKGGGQRYRPHQTGKASPDRKRGCWFDVS